MISNGPNYSSTHKLFKIGRIYDFETSSWPDIEMCREHLGDNDKNQLLQLRPWFTTFEGVWIRTDCLNNELVTWFALRSKE